MRQPTAELIFETHSISEDNERGLASGWNPTRLSARGRQLAKEVGIRNARVDAVFTSDLVRAVETAELAFQGSATPILADPRLRECNYGSLSGRPTAELHPRSRFINAPYPGGGESYLDVVARVTAFLDEIAGQYDRPVLLVGHSATRWALEHLLLGTRLEDLVDAPFEWRPGWRFPLAAPGL